MESSPITTILIISSALVALLYIVRRVIKNKRDTPNNPELTEAFFNQLDKKFDLDLVNSKEDIIVLADSFRREKSAVYNFGQLMEDYMRHLVTKASYSDENAKPKLTARYKSVYEILKIERQEKPFADLPDTEKRILRDLHSAINSNSKESALNTLEDLRITILSKKKIYDQSDFLNKLSIPLAIVGLILTIYFGIKSLPVESKKEIKNDISTKQNTLQKTKDTLKVH